MAVIIVRSVVEWIRASATEMVDSGSIPGRVKPKTLKIGVRILTGV